MGSADKAKDENGRDDAGKTGPEGTIPDSKDGVAAASTGKPSHFEPEEDEESAEGSPGDS